MRCDTIRYDTIRYDTIRNDTIRYDTIRYDRYDTIRYDTIDTIRYDTIRYCMMSLTALLIFSQLNIGGSASLSANSNISLKTFKASGDQSGEIVVRPSQSVRFNSSDGYIPYSVHGRKRSFVQLPSITKCRGVGIKLSGTVHELKNLTVGSGCQFSLENTIARSFDFEHVLVQRLGHLNIKHRDNVEMKLYGVTLAVHGGGKVETFSIILKQSHSIHDITKHNTNLYHCLRFRFIYCGLYKLI